jgi:hypothetical protein
MRNRRGLICVHSTIARNREKGEIKSVKFKNMKVLGFFGHAVGHGCIDWEVEMTNPYRKK